MTKNIQSKEAIEKGTPVTKLVARDLSRDEVDQISGGDLIITGTLTISFDITIEVTVEL